MSITPLVASGSAWSRVGVRRAVAALVFATLSGIAVAHAEPTESDRATARALAEEGNRALQIKNYDLAEDRFRRADALVHAPSLVVDWARALVGMGRLGAAYRLYDQTRKEQLPPAAPASWKRAVADAEREIKPLEPKLGWVTVTIRGPAEAQVSVAEEELPSSALGKPFALEGGEHTLRVSAEGFLTREQALPLSAGQKLEVTVALDPVPQAPVAVAPVAPKPVRKAPEPPPPPPPTSKWTYAAFGVGAAGLAVGTVSFVLFLGERSRLQSTCPSQKKCPAEARDDVNRQYVYSYASGIGFVLGVVGAGAGTVLLLNKPSDSSENKQGALVVSPYISPGMVGVEGTF